MRSRSNSNAVRVSAGSDGVGKRGGDACFGRLEVAGVDQRTISSTRASRASRPCASPEPATEAVQASNASSSDAASRHRTGCRAGAVANGIRSMSTRESPQWKTSQAGCVTWPPSAVNNLFFQFCDKGNIYSATHEDVRLALRGSSMIHMAWPRWLSRRAIGSAAAVVMPGADAETICSWPSSAGGRTCPAAAGTTGEFDAFSMVVGRVRGAAGRRAVAGARQARAATCTIPAHGVIGIEEQHLTPEFWVARLATPDAVVMDTAAIAAQNATLLRTDPTIHDLRALPATLARAQVAAWIEALSQRPDARDLRRGRRAGARRDARRAGRRACDRTRSRKRSPRATAWWCIAPTCARSRPRCGSSARSGDTDIDRFQESALFPGTPVAIAARKPRRAMVVRRQPALRGLDREDATSPKAAPRTVFGYADKAPYRVVTGATVRTVFTPRSSRASPNCSSTWACACRWPTGRPTSRSTASIPTPRT